MNTQNKKQSPVIVLALGAVGLCATVGLAAWWMGRVVPPGLDASPEQLLKYSSSDSFKSLTLDQKKPYAEKLEETYLNDPDRFDALSEADKDALRRNVGGTLMDLRVSKYLSLKSEDERNKYIDQQLDEMKKRMASALMRRLAGKGTGGAGRPPFMPSKGQTPDQQKNSIENRDSVKLAGYMDYMHRVAERAEARGIPLPIPLPGKK